MSMNLTLHGVDGCGHVREIDLYQTPTNVTWDCLSYNPETGLPEGGEEGVRQRYIQWLEGRLENETDDNRRDLIKDHISKILAVKNPSFSYI